jgi:hypothetical protein
VNDLGGAGYGSGYGAVGSMKATVSPLEDEDSFAEVTCLDGCVWL